MVKYSLHIDNNSSEPKYRQIVNAVIRLVKEGKLKVGDQLLSLNDLSIQLEVAKDTVQRAYQNLREKGIVEAVPGKGFYIKASYVDAPMRILLIFNKMTAYKKTIFNAFANAISTKAVVDLQVHYFDEMMFEKIIESSLGQYSHYVVMPFFYQHTSKLKETFNRIPREKLLLLNKKPDFLQDCRAVFEDFENDIYNVLMEFSGQVAAYEGLILVFPEDPMSNKEIQSGFIKYCEKTKSNWQIVSGTNSLILKDKMLYIVIDDDDLAVLIKQCQESGLKVGKDIGVISYNDTVLKEVLENGISVISTDFEHMGEQAAEMILKNKYESIKNPFRMIRRRSF